MHSSQKFSHKISREGFDKISKEYEELLTTRPACVARLDTARRMGDLSENSEYHAAKESLGFLDGRLAEYKELIKGAVIVEGNGGDSKNSIGIGSKVKLNILGQNREVEYTLVGEYEADMNNGKISINSPLGVALVDKKLGEKVKMESPSGVREFEIISIE